MDNNKLYRGMKINPLKLNDFDFLNTIPLPNEYIYEKGRKCVIDGNEYGIYMSDNKQMIEDAYGKDNGAGIPIDKDIRINGKNVSIPFINVIYTINTTDIKDNIKEPFICDAMKGHYNNGYQGKEWISTKEITKNNISNIELSINSDLLNDKQIINIIGKTDFEIKEEINNIIKTRTTSLNRLINDLKKNPDEISNLKNRCSYIDLQNIKELYKINGILDKNIDIIKNKQDLYTKIIKENIKKNGLSLKNIKNINLLFNKLNDFDNINDVSMQLKNLPDDIKNSNRFKDSISLINEIITNQNRINNSLYTIYTIVDKMDKLNNDIFSINKEHSLNIKPININFSNDCLTINNMKYPISYTDDSINKNIILNINKTYHNIKENVNLAYNNATINKDNDYQIEK